MSLLRFLNKISGTHIVFYVLFSFFNKRKENTMELVLIEYNVYYINFD